MPTAPSLEYEFTMSVTLAESLTVGAGAYGVRVVAPAVRGSVVGTRLNGEITGPGADWLLIGNDGYGRVDVRLQIATDDGALVYLTYDGILQLTDAAVAAAGTPGVESGWDDQYFRTSPRFETGAPQYTWLQQSMFVARGRLSLDGVQYEVFRVA